MSEPIAMKVVILLDTKPKHWNKHHIAGYEAEDTKPTSIRNDGMAKNEAGLTLQARHLKHENVAINTKSQSRSLKRKSSNGNSSTLVSAFGGGNMGSLFCSFSGARPQPDKR